MPSPDFAVLSVLAFLGTGGLIFVALVAALWGRSHGNRLLTRRGLQLAGILILGYGMVLAGFSLVSQERVLSPGAEKYFCELDCHLAYSVERVVPVQPAIADHSVWAIRLRTRFDERTISPRRSREAPLWPNPRRLALIGSDGQAYEETENVPAVVDQPSTPLTRELKPGESYSTSLVFSLPAGVTPSKLRLTEDLFVNHFIIGHEQSFFHRAVLLGLPGAGG